MIKINEFSLHNAQNKPFLRSKAPISFEDNTLYFIIGRSGVGKTSLIDFITSPFTEEPIKNGEIEFSSDIAPIRLWKDTLMTSIKIKNSFSFFYRAYYRFIRRSIAFIPQKTDSFHPAVPVSRQMFRNYKVTAGPKANWENFKTLLEKLSPYAGW
jgi:ABC-type glutathione transport system ATPase component